MCYEFDDPADPSQPARLLFVGPPPPGSGLVCIHACAPRSDEADRAQAAGADEGERPVSGGGSQSGPRAFRSQE